MILRASVSLVYAFLLLPMVIVVLAAFNAGNYFTFPPQGFSLKWFGNFFHRREFMLVLPRIARSTARLYPRTTAERAQAVPRVTHRPGHFSTESRPRSLGSRSAVLRPTTCRVPSGRPEGARRFVSDQRTKGRT